MLAKPKTSSAAINTMHLEMNEYLMKKNPYMKSSVFKHTWMKGKPNEIGFEVHWNEYLKTFMKSSVFKHTWMQGKPNEIGFELHWNEYLKTMMTSSVFKHTWMHEASEIKSV